MSYFDFNYPHTDFHELNLDWILSKIKEFEQRLDSISDDIVKKANEYTDSKLAGIQKDFADFKTEVNATLSDIDSKYAAFTSEVNRRLLIMDNRLDKMQDTVDSTIKVANDYTNQAIANNNEYIINETTKALSTVKVINYFTGEKISIQGMFDYLSQFHLTNAIRNGVLRDRQLTNQHIADLNISNTEIVIDGGNLLV